ncbi:hypothetical protein [Microbulbifer sp. JMSA003]|uniref:hypothetical protein n=1 Tax=Microbulbifer sp. JMSA003 TaxID=3243369 RepID=UPI004039F383
MSINIEEINGIVNYVSRSKIFVNIESDGVLSQLGVKDLVSRLKVGVNFEVAFIYACDKCAIYQAVGRGARELYSWDFESNVISHICKFDGDLSFVDRIDDYLILKSNKKYLVKLGLADLEVELYRDGKVFGKVLPFQEGLVFFNPISEEIGLVNLEGESLISLPILDLLPGESILKLSHQDFFTFEDWVILGGVNGPLFCIDVLTRTLLWRVDYCLGKRWTLDAEGKIYSVYNGNLKIIEVKTGDVLLDRLINADWVQAKKDTLNLFQVSVSKTHLWCGFLGRGLCAINLKTAEVDWHEFDGRTCNRNPIIKNNRIYVQIMGGGIGLDNEGTKEYVLEGEGGYIENSDNEFIVF